MNNKRFRIESSIIVDGKYTIFDNTNKYKFSPMNFEENIPFFKALNDLHERNECYKDMLEHERKQKQKVIDLLKEYMRDESKIKMIANEVNEK